MEISFIVLVLYLRLVQPQGIPSECQNCGCCKPGQDKCYYDGYCTYGCLDGYWNTKCTLKCKYINCKRCARSDGSYCHECKTGFYGDECGSSCAPYCEVCHRRDGRCYSCVKGHWGTNCSNKCGDQCKKCHRWRGCAECNTGYHGSKCENNCGYYCVSCDIQNGCTACKPGYYSNNGGCKHCKNKNRGCTCTSYYNCVGCTKGYFLHIDRCLPCSHHCTTCISSTQCTSCTEGRFGNICQHQCTGDCVNGNCDSSKATCQCNANYEGKKCDQCIARYSNNGCKQRCSEGCVNNECDSYSGICSQGCINGYWNPTCDKRCNAECLSCNQADGSCSQCINTTKYGHNCTQDCSNTCKKSICDITGKCTNGCITNTFGKQCENTCDEHCIKRDNNTLCSEKTGMCLYGCETGYKGTFCPQEEEKQTSSTILGGAVGGGVVALAVIVVFGLFLLRRRRTNSNNTNTTHNREPENSSLYATMNKEKANRAANANEATDDVHSVSMIKYPHYQSPPPKENTPILIEHNLEMDADKTWEPTVMSETNGGVYYNNAREISKFKLSVVDLPEYVQSVCIEDLEEEFQKIPYGLMKPYEVSQMKHNMNRNRYKGIYPYDDTRVVVRGGDTDYINASYIDGFRKRNAYIATLGPTAKQLGDFGQFWRMVWQQKVERIVMVTNLVEGQETKCDKYWPDQYQSKLYGDTEVVCTFEKLYADFIWRQFTFSKGKQNKEERNLHHLQFTAWPDKDIPDNVTSIIEFRQKVNALPTTFDGPVIVHCSAGVGRTGTYIGLDVLTKEGEAEGAIDIPGCVLNMRQNRPNMVQTLNQYKYLHQALVHSLTLDCSLIKIDYFHDFMHMMSSKQEIQKQFEKMQLHQEQKSDKELQATEKNRLLIKKNRKHADIPGDANRPRLYLFLNLGESDYINAIYINSFKTKNRFLVAQTPLPDTVSDFIALVIQENCSCIVSMETQGIGLYVPGDNQSLMNFQQEIKVRDSL
ncbi:receptor-type tyrosine-protein phosphatase mu-like isoform X2 [Mya arenaria]|uniref:receptor-type tyrosine-protein phosphatase mu-like isoform X2 n=1 Tax=Mya arenaria TaxID=6604 RepID=UPI0022E8B1FF|nr:receptor-type tyrosine-protein phosphatase mu-like isoform X2 [Mya arenaria]